ncbi:TonB-dependent receptor [Frateuria terrea]|uniref:TonB-dependent Receptor Plug Domain n=1 Tax=Frateuria terrea TaxID=529704 RepID=A0A1H6V8M5_9GAMM|nr:TonB-dependent receptor [Frateuria terrea]SEJ00989.1 TonB-dependent Receptor Plug Domain [Frateuria terrea]SFP65290.1 TonB-dependent Receptor Plug Domain [Frateuria terrea]
MSHDNYQRIHRPLRTATGMSMAVALALYGALGAPAFAQTTTGSIFGQAPAAAGATVTVQNASGVTRQATVDAAGRYTIGALPLGNYTVTLQRDGTTLDTRNDVELHVGAGTEVSFLPSTGAQNLSAVTVTANGLPAVDVSQVDSRTVITSQQLARLPLARSAEAIALLAPGTVQGSDTFMGMGMGVSSPQKFVSFGGSSVTENAYYINGFNTTDPISGFGGLTLPYGSIDQEEILSGGYGAAYGRSDGGVISQVGKRGTNEWHFGGQVLWKPKSLQGDPRDIYYGQGSPDAGQLYWRRGSNKSSTTTVDAYVGGPLIKDTLYLFASMEGERIQGTGASGGTPSGAIGAPAGVGINAPPSYENHSRLDDPKWYAKLDWNINDSNLLELTGASNKTSYRGNLYQYDYATGKQGAFDHPDLDIKDGSDLYLGKFTSFLTDDLTLSVLYGKMKGTHYSQLPGYDPSLAPIIGQTSENPDITGGQTYGNAQTSSQLFDPQHVTRNTNLRLDVSYKLGPHMLTAGIDNQDVRDIHDGQFTSGPGYGWLYESGDPASFIIGGPDANGAGWQGYPWVQAPGNYPGGSTGYYVSRQVFANSASVRVKQHAQYIEDAWQVSDRWLVKIGLRNDQFTNYNGVGVPYLRLTHSQLAPRLGFTWDVNGDSSLKVYGNAGRYYLAVPASVALRSAGSSTFTNQFYTYTGIDPAIGYPTGLTPIDTYLGVGQPVSRNLEYGQPRDPKTAAATNIKSEYQDELILGFDKQLSDAWVYGAKATWRKLGRAIDDWGDTGRIAAKMAELGMDDYDKVNGIQGSYLINPGENPIIQVPKLSGGYYQVPLDWRKDMGFNTSLKRKYYALDLYLEHPFDGKWYGKVDYLFSRNYGNTEGQVRSDFGQTDVSATVDWDYTQVMDYANGALPNDRRHQIKAYGYYQVTPEWLVSGNVAILSGAPKTCLGLYGPDQTNPGLGYGSFYHYCGGTPVSPGYAREPWTYLLSLGAEYRPDWANRRLAFHVQVYNVLDQQRITQVNGRYGSSTNVRPTYNLPLSTQPPRYVQLGITYDY